MKRFLKKIIYGDNVVSNTRKRIYYHYRYYYSRVKIYFYCKIHRYPVSRIFLKIPADMLVNTEFNASYHRDISSRNVYRIIGKVIDGDWDLNRTPIYDWDIYRGLKEFLIDGRKLKETVYYRDNSRTTRSIWYGVHDGNYKREVERNNKLFHTLRENGYRSQKELGGPDPLDEIRVKIARDGEFLWENSIHRFVVAKLLNLEKITVVVTVRHLEWVNLKKRLIHLSKKTRQGKSEDYNKRYTHPDLAEIPYRHEGEILIKNNLQSIKMKEKKIPTDNRKSSIYYFGEPNK